MPASAASMIASAANGGGTNTMRGGRAGFLDSALHGVEHRHAQHGLAALARRHAANDIGAILIMSSAWNWPIRPEMPCTMTLVFS
jgi:hypothetical protein